MVHSISLNDDSSHIHSISYVNTSNIEELYQESQIDLDEYVSSPQFSMDTSSLSHHKATLFLGGTVLIISIVVAVVALTVICGIAQSVLVGVAISGAIVGGSLFLRSLIGIIYNKLKKEEDLSHISTNAKKALLIGIGLTVLGFFSRVSAMSISGMGNYGQILDKIGTTAYDMGTFSVFNALTQLIYDRLFFKGHIGEVNTNSQSSKLEENKKNVTTSVLLSSIGVGLAVLGISLLIIGSVMIPGSGQILALAFSVPFLSAGISLLMKNIINFPWQSLKELLENKLLKKEQKHFSSVLIHSQKEIKRACLETSSLSTSEKKVSDSEFSLEKKMALTVSIFFLLVSLALVLTSVFLPGAALQIKLLSSIGGVILSTSLPIMISGISAVAVHLKNKHQWLNKVKVRNNKIISRVNNPSELEDSDKVVDLEKIVKQQEVINKKFETKILVILASISILFGVGFMLLSLVPGALSISGVVAIGSPFLIIGGLILVDKAVLLLREEIQRLQIKREKRRKRISLLPNFVQEAIEEM